MNISGTPYRTIWLDDDGASVMIIDQTKLPFEFVTKRLETLAHAERAIRDMEVRGAPLIGATAAYGLCLGLRDDPSDSGLEFACGALLETRPTAVNLRAALARMNQTLAPLSSDERVAAAYQLAADFCDEDVETNLSIGANGLKVISEIAAKKTEGDQVNILTHCNAGWLATVDRGTALSPIYAAFDAGIPVHVWVDETRPRNQGASLTAWELKEHGVPHTLIVDNAGGHLMQHGQVDVVITGTDRTTADGDVCNKIGTYLKALAAFDNDVPFYVGLPGPTIDWTIHDGVKEIPIEERSGDEVIYMTGRQKEGDGVTRVLIAPEDCNAANPAFDVTPARLITGLITERGIAPASRQGLADLYPDYVKNG